MWQENTNSSFNIAIMADALARAGTASFLSSDQNAFFSRMAGSIVQQDFPPWHSSWRPLIMGMLGEVRWQRCPISIRNNLPATSMNFKNPSPRRRSELLKILCFEQKTDSSRLICWNEFGNPRRMEVCRRSAIRS